VTATIASNYRIKLAT